MASVPDPIGGLVLITPAQRRFVQTLNNMLENDPLPKESIETLKNIFQNILKQPNELKFRKLKANNPKFHERVGKFKCAVKVLEHAGFIYSDGEFSRKGVLQDEDAWELRAVAEALASPKIPIRPDDILFYDVKAPFGEFSNFYPAGVKIDNKVWPTTEHYFQAQKFVGTKFEEEIRAKATPDEAKKRGSDRTLPLRKDWEQVKEDIMYKACLAKFTQHEKLKQKLISTGRAYIVEHTADDAYWGDGGGEGLGKNRLGAVLMKVRAALIAQVEAAKTQAASEQAAQKIEQQHAQHVKQAAPAASSSKAPAQTSAPAKAPAPAPAAKAPAPAASSSKAPAPAAKAPAPAPAASSSKAPAPAASSSKAPAPASSSVKAPPKK